MSFLSRQATQIIKDLSPQELARQPTLRYEVRKENDVIITDEMGNEEWTDRPKLIKPYKGKLTPLSDVSDIEDLWDDEEDVKPRPATKRKAMDRCDDDDVHELFRDYDWAEGLEEELKNENPKKVKKGKKNDRGPCVIAWCVTWNNPDINGEELCEKLKGNALIKGFAFQLEKGESGTLHFQMYLEFKSQQYCSGVRNALGTDACSTFKALHGKNANVKYCTKQDSREEGPWVYGTCEKPEKSGNQGKRNDLDKFAKMVWEEGGITDEVEDEFHGYVIRYGKMAREALAHANLRKAKALELEFWREQIRLENEGLATTGQEAVDMVLLFGPSAVGKTTWAIKDCVENFDALPYIKDGNKEWFDGYTNQEGIIIDEWRKNSGSIESINQFTRKGATQVEYKGGYTTLLAKKFYFTSNRHPLDIFETVPEEGRYRALMRRFKEVHWWNDTKELKVLKNPHGMMGDEKDEAEQEWNKFWNRLRYPAVRRIEYEGNDRDAPRFTMVTEAVNENLYFTW